MFRAELSLLCLVIGWEGAVSVTYEELKQKLTDIGVKFNEWGGRIAISHWDWNYVGDSEFGVDTILNHRDAPALKIIAEYLESVSVEGQDE